MISGNRESSLGFLLLSRNHAPWIRSALESVTQELSGVPIVLVDVGSTDSTLLEALEFSHGIKASMEVVEFDGPTVSSLGRGIQELDTDFVAFLSADDRLLPGYGSRVRSWLSEPHRGTGLNFALQLEDTLGNLLGLRRPQWTNSRVANQQMLSLKNLGTAPGAIFDRRILNQSSYVKKHGHCLVEDHLLWFELLSYGNIDKVSEPLVAYRRHKESLSASLSEQFIEAVGYSFGYISSSVALGPFADQARRIKRITRTPAYRRGFQMGQITASLT